MARKFNLGRQSEHALNQEMHDLLMSLKYINNGSKEPTQDYQTPIPLGAVWNDNNYGQNVLKVNTANNGWDPMFKGYYHPADLFTKPLSPVHGQLWIDANKDNTLHFYDQNTNAWIAVKAVTTSSNQILVDMFNNFMHMFPLKAINSSSTYNDFLIPNENYGKLIDNGAFIHPSDSKYIELSDISVRYNSLSSYVSWAHVNPHKLFTMEKKLVKNFKTGTYAYKIYGLYDNNTEFFFLDSNNEWLHMQPFDITTNKGDFKSFDKGIELVSTRAKASNYIMSYSYSFYDTANPGKLIKKDFTTGSSSQVHIGQSTKQPMIFIDGLYLEQHMYDYDNETGNLLIHDTIQNPMNLMSIVFENSESVDFEINQTINGTNDILIGNLSRDYINPMVFVSGVLTNELFVPEQIIYDRNANSITVKNWGPHNPDDVSYAMVVEADSMYMEHGKFDNTKTIRNDDISINEEYMLWTDGVLISSKDLDISEGAIKLANATENTEYILLRIVNDETTAFMFDGQIMNYTVAIKNEDGSLYNECDNACVFVNGKALMMSDTVLKQEKPIKGANGQIIKIKDCEDDSIYTYLIYNQDTASWDNLAINEQQFIESLIKADFSNGTIMVDSEEGLKGTYYAYTYANSIEEPLLTAKRDLIRDTTTYSVNVKHMFNTRQGAFSAYVNKLLSHDAYEELSNVGKFIVPIQIGPKGTDNINNDINNKIDPYNNGEIMYIIERPEKDETKSCERELLTAQDRDLSYTNAYKTSISLIPGIVSVFVNGIRLEKNDFTVIDDNTIVLHTAIVGSQKNYDENNIDTWNEYLYYDYQGEHTLKSIRDDYIIIEVRQDFDIRNLTIPVRYQGQTTFYTEDDGIPSSLILSQDYIKIYINGVIYDGEYVINKEKGSISLLDNSLDNILNVDPISRYFEMNPDEYEKYVLNNDNQPYVAKKITDRITFEWR